MEKEEKQKGWMGASLASTEGGEAGKGERGVAALAISGSLESLFRC